MKIGKILKELRQQKNMTQMEVSSKIGVTAATYSRYESDLLEPNLDTLLELAIIFMEDPSIFFREELLKKTKISMDTETGYSLIFSYWHLEEIAKVLNLRRSELTLPALNTYARSLQVAFEQIAISQERLSEIMKPESFDEFLKRTNLEWLFSEEDVKKIAKKVQ
jgi:transcriptional regulator with XRE-family HTH domain